MDKLGIYKITNTINSKTYIGSSKHLTQRFKEHRHALNSNKHHSRVLQNSWNKYGESSFEFSVLEECTIDELTLREQYYLDELKPELNVLPNARSFSGHKWTEDAKLRSSQARKGLLSSDEARRRGALSQNRKYATGWTATPETKLKMAKSKMKPVVGEHTSGTTLEFESVAEAAKFINKSVPTMCRYLKQEKEYENYKWRFK